MTSIPRTLRWVAPVLAAVPLAASAVPVAASTPPSSPAAAIDGLGSRLQVAMSDADPHGNLVLSPLSVEVALAMASAGAAGDTLVEMHEVLGLAASSGHAELAALVAGVARRGDGDLTVANSLWTQAGLGIVPAFAATLGDVYESEPHQADFAADPDAARHEVNGWVSEATAERIIELLPADSVDTSTRLVLVNAVGLDAEWASPFAPDSTWSSEFTTGTGATVEVPMMHQTLHAGYASSGGLQAVTLPYTSGLEMVVVLPGAGGLGDLERALADAGGDLDALVGDSQSTEVMLSLPRWEIETGTSLVAPLQAIGMVTAFEDTADFSAMSSDEPLKIGDVVHQANITVDEAGTEAAAATAVMMAAGAAPDEDQPVVMEVDRPFFFAVRDAETGAVVFQGHVNDPS